jgi:hypothetical protein
MQNITVSQFGMIRNIYFDDMKDQMLALLAHTQMRITMEAMVQGKISPTDLVLQECKQNDTCPG